MNFPAAFESLRLVCCLPHEIFHVLSVRLQGHLCPLLWEKQHMRRLCSPCHLSAEFAGDTKRQGCAMLKWVDGSPMEQRSCEWADLV